MDTGLKPPLVKTDKNELELGKTEISITWGEVFEEAIAMGTDPCK